MSFLSQVSFFATNFTRLNDLMLTDELFECIDCSLPWVLVRGLAIISEQEQWRIALDVKILAKWSILCCFAINFCHVCVSFTAEMQFIPSGCHLDTMSTVWWVEFDEPRFVSNDCFGLLIHDVAIEVWVVQNDWLITFVLCRHKSCGKKEQTSDWLHLFLFL